MAKHYFLGIHLYTSVHLLFPHPHPPGLVLDPPDMGEWAPRLESLHIREGDRIHVIVDMVTVLPDYEAVQGLTGVKNTLACNDRTLAMLVAKTDAVSTLKPGCSNLASKLGQIGAKMYRN